MTNYRDEFDYVIFGSGAAGSTLAYFLAKQDFTVALVDIAKKRTNSEKNRYRPPFINSCTNCYTPSYSGVFGGNTNLWSGKIYLLSEKEMANWPVKYNTLYRHSEQLAHELNISHKEVCNTEEIDGNTFYHTSKRSNLGNLFETFNLEYKKNVTCYEETVFLDAEFDPKLKKINRVKVLLAGQEVFLKISKSIILCCGGLGNLPIYGNILQACEWINDPPNRFPLHDHCHINVGAVDPSKFDRISKGYLKNDKGNNTEDCVVVFGKSNTYAFQVDGPRDLMRWVKKIYFRTEIRSLQNLILKLEKFSSFLIDMFKIVFKRFFNRHHASFELFFAESKKTKSEIKLVKQHSIDGEYVYKLDIDYCPTEINSAIVSAEMTHFAGDFCRNLHKKHFMHNRIYTGLHPSCSTPIRQNPRLGEINTDLQIEGIDNLYMVGSNLFPSNGVTNPTWTIMVLAHMLSTKLVEKTHA